MEIRKPIVAGRFYPGSKTAVTVALDEYLSLPVDVSLLPKRIVAGIVPHAGWVCSGAVAAKVFRAIALRRSVETFILLGAVHRYGVSDAAVYSVGGWETPLGLAAVDEPLAAQILMESNFFKTQNTAHQLEHSIEVQIPFIQRLFPQAKIVPIMVSPTACALEVGSAIARVVDRTQSNAVVIASSDLTHYGPDYNFTPKGSGPAGIQWAKDVNDRGLLELILQMDPKAALEYAQTAQAACGCGAIAAAVGYAAEFDATDVRILEHTTSYEVLRQRFGERSEDSVGYAGVIFGKPEGT